MTVSDPVDERRLRIADAALSLLAREGARGLTHRAVDAELRLPSGSTSYYYRTRAALLLAAAERLIRRYDEQQYVYGEAPNDCLREVAHYLPQRGEVLCLAEGEGRNAVFLARRELHVTAVDASAVGLRKAERLAEAQGVSIHTVVADLAAYDLGLARWDGIVSIWCHVPSALRTRLHRAVVAALKPGGVFVLEAYTPRQLGFGTGGPPDVDMLMTLDGLRVELAGLELIVQCDCEREVHEGKLHNGMSAVVQLVARKQ